MGSEMCIRDSSSLARFTAIEGSVKVKAVGSFEWVSADTKMVLHKGDLVRTGSGSLASIEFFDENKHKLLDRLGDRTPYPDDLDDPLFAALAVLAADVDLDEVSPQRTRRTMTEHGLWPPQMDTGTVSAGRLIELPPAGPNASVASGAQPGWTPESRAQALAAEARAAQLRGIAAFADPGRTVGVRLVPALAAAGAALVLSMGAAAALTSGQSLAAVASANHARQRGSRLTGSSP